LEQNLGGFFAVDIYGCRAPAPNRWEFFLGTSSTACCRSRAEFNGCRAATPALLVGLPACGVLPPGQWADVEVF
jgi:hypothetical protein